MIGRKHPKFRIGLLGVSGVWLVATVTVLATWAPTPGASSLWTMSRVMIASLVYVLGLYWGDLLDREPWTLLPTRLSAFRCVVRLLALVGPSGMSVVWLGAPFELVTVHLVATVGLARAAQSWEDRLGWRHGWEHCFDPKEGAGQMRTAASDARNGMSAAGRALKRAIDIVAGLLLLVTCFPLCLCVAVAIRLEDGGPVLFSQVRVGQDGRPFRIRKMRSMCRNAEATTGPVWSTADDPRITRVGQWIRTTRLDEVPQAWNLLVGEMSLVGPRPERPEFEERLRQAIPGYELRHRMRPGLTGWAQVNLPQSASIETARRKLQYDLYYVRHASPLFDAYILARSVKMLLAECESFLAHRHRQAAVQ